jgi:hypothetical protein
MHDKGTVSREQQQLAVHAQGKRRKDYELNLAHGQGIVCLYRQI